MLWCSVKSLVRALDVPREILGRPWIDLFSRKLQITDTAQERTDAQKLTKTMGQMCCVAPGMCCVAALSNVDSQPLM